MVEIGNKDNADFVIKYMHGTPGKQTSIEKPIVVPEQQKAVETAKPNFPVTGEMRFSEIHREEQLGGETRWLESRM